MVAAAEERIAAVQDRIERAAKKSGRSASAVTLVAVTKTVPLERVLPFLQAGIKHIGENRVQEALTKYANAEGVKTLPGDVRLHMIGTLQTNKAKKAVQLCDMIQTLDRDELGEQLNRHAQALGKQISCLVEVKLSDEGTKTGLAAEKLPDFLAKASGWTNLQVNGLMGIPPRSATGEAARPYFARLQKLRAACKLEMLSMGMSSDFEVAIEEGATMVRLGTILFGERSQ